jgi:sugar-specific transcriptional regulator TrmB
METSTLEKIGMSRGEIKVYLALSRLGESTITPIVYESRVSKSKIYDILARLIDKGLAGYVVKNNVKYFIASDPHTILEYVERKENDLLSAKKSVEQLIPELIAAGKETQSKRLVEVYEGFLGIKSIREGLMGSLQKSGTLLILGAPKAANDKWEGWLLDFHRRRIKMGISARIIYNANAREYGKIRSKMKLTTVRYFTNALVSPNWIDVYPDSVLFGIVSPHPLAFVIRNREIADSFRVYFEVMWQNSVK